SPLCRETLDRGLPTTYELAWVCRISTCYTLLPIIPIQSILKEVHQHVDAGVGRGNIIEQFSMACCLYSPVLQERMDKQSSRSWIFTQAGETTNHRVARLLGIRRAPCGVGEER